MKPRELTLEGFEEYLTKRFGRAFNLTYDDVQKVTGYELRTLYNAVFSGDLEKQGNSKPARFNHLGLYKFMDKRGWIPA